MEESRTKKTGKNIVFSIVYYIVKIIASFTVRTIFIRVFGVKYLGLNGIFSNVLSILSLAELGIGSAIVFNMYKPMAEGDNEKLKSLLSLYKKFYTIVSIIVLALGLAIIPLLPSIIDYSSLPGINITILYLLTLASTLLSYFMAHRRALLYTSQNKYIESIISSIVYVIMVVLQLVVLFVFKDYYIYISVTIISTVIESLAIFAVTKKMFPSISGKAEPLDNDIKKNIISNTKAIFLHKIGGVTLNATDMLVMQIALNSLVISGIFSNYLLIYTTVISMINMIIDATQGSVGNLIAIKDSEYVYGTFKKINFGFSWLFGFCSIALLCLYNPFISTMWGAENTFDMWFVLTYAFTFYINLSRQVAYSFKSAAGIFRQDRFAPIIESLLNIVISYLLVVLLGPVGVVLGTVISCLIVPFWCTPKMLFKYYFKKTMKEYWLAFIKYLLVTIVSGAITYVAIMFIPGGSKWILVAKFAIVAILPNIVYLLFYFRTEEFKYFKNIALKVLKKKQPAADSAGAINMDAAVPIVDIDGDGIGDIPIEQVLTTDDIQNKDDFENKKTSGENGDKTSQDEMVHAVSKNKSANKTKRAGVKKTEKKKNS